MILLTDVKVNLFKKLKKFPFLRMFIQDTESLILFFTQFIYAAF